MAAALVAALSVLGAEPRIAVAEVAPDCALEQVHMITDDGPVSFQVELARTPSEQSVGLMFRPSLAEDAGMLFIYPNPARVSFWMKNTMIPLDMIFIDDAGVVVNIAAETEPYSLAPRGSEGAVRAVLEINGGLSAKLGIEPGTQAVHPAFAAAPAPYSCIAAE